MLLKVSEVRKLIRSKKKRASKDYLEYLSRKLEKIVLGHINQIGSRGTLRAKDFVFIDEFNKRT